MALIVNTKGVEAKEMASYIEKAGTYRFKVTSTKEDGYADNGEPKVKVDFECNKIVAVDGKPTLEEITYKHTEVYATTQNIIWKIAIIRDAMKAPEVFNFEDLVGRFVIAEISMKEYNGKNYAQINKLSYSKANDALGAIPEAVVGVEDASADVPKHDVNEDEIPF